MAPVHPYVYISIIFLIITIVTILYRMLTVNYGMPKKKPQKHKDPMDLIDLTKFDNGQVMVPTRFIEDVRKVISGCPEEEIIAFWVTGDIDMLRAKYYLEDEEIEWFKNRYQFYNGQYKRFKRLEKKFSLFNILTFGLFDD